MFRGILVPCNEIKHQQRRNINGYSRESLKGHGSIREFEKKKEKKEGET